MSGNGPGFSSREEAERFHAQRMRPRQTNLQYAYGARDFTGPVREAMPPSPLDGDQYFQRGQATEQAQQAKMDKFMQESAPAPVVPQPRKKTLKEIAMEQGQIPRKR